MEETVAATAVAVKYLGNAILKTKSGELLELARGVEEAAGVDCGDLSRAVGALQQASDEERIRAIVDLRDASPALEKIACPTLDSLRGAAANLALTCREYKEAADAIASVQREQEQQDSEGWGSGGWCSFAWRRRQSHPAGTLSEGFLADGDQGSRDVPAKELAVAIDMVGKAMLEFEKRGDDLVAQAKNVVAAANSVTDLGTAATAMQRADSNTVNALRDRTAELARECYDLKEAANAMAAVQHVAAEQRERQVAGTAASSVPSDEPGQGDYKRSTWRGMAY